MKKFSSHDLLEPLNINENGKSYTFDCPMIDMKKYNLFSTGTICDFENPKISFINSVLLCKAKNYIGMEEEMKRKKIFYQLEKIKNKMMDSNEYRGSYEKFKKNLTELIFEFYSYFEEQKKEKVEEDTEEEAKEDMEKIYKNSTYSDAMLKLIKLLKLNDLRSNKIYRVITMMLSKKSVTKILGYTFKKWKIGDDYVQLKYLLKQEIDDFIRLTDFLDEVDEKKKNFLSIRKN